MAHRIITAELLRALEACSEQVDLFAATWPSGLELPTTEEGIAEIAARAATLGLDFQWAADALLSARGRRAYDEAAEAASEVYEDATVVPVGAYYEAMDAARSAYDEARAATSGTAASEATASWAYLDATATARRAYNDAVDAALRVYHEATAPARKAYDEVRATEILRQLMLDAEVSS